MESIDGFALFSEDRGIPFHFENNYLELFLGGSTFTFKKGVKVIIGKKHGTVNGGLILFHLALPLENFVSLKTPNYIEGVSDEVPISTGTVKYEVDFYIDNYVDDSKFTRMEFSFAELKYFIPSSKMCNYFSENRNLEFIGKPKIIKSFNFKYKGRSVTLTLKLTTDYKLSNKWRAETDSILVFEFAETDDYNFFLDLYRLVHSLFSFLCNRQNISLEKAFLKDIFVSSELNVINKYKEKNEDSQVIAKTIKYCILSSAFEGLFSMFLDDKVSVLSMHSSRAARSLLDLKQCLQITAAFEYYHRTFLPEISSDETIQVYDDIRRLIKEYVDAQSGNKKKKAQHLLNALSPAVSLSDKICKVYYGYDSWSGVETILSEHFKNDNISKLASVANIWRNDLAHEKREYEPDQNVIAAIRLVEYLNYCIVLRKAGYADDEIKIILGEILTR